MHLYLGGHLNYFDAQQRVNIEIDLVGKQQLADVLDRLKIPIGEVALITINGEVLSLEDAWIKQEDHVQVYPPMGGG